jgi:hypothetical protein
VRYVLVLRGSAVVEVAFAVVDSLQRVSGAVKSQKFDPLPGSAQGLQNGVATPQYHGEQDFFLLFPCLDASAEVHGGRRTVAV